MQYKRKKYNLHELRFPTFSAWELRNKVNGPQIRILREISSLEPAPKVWKPKSRSKNLGFVSNTKKYVFHYFCLFLRSLSCIASSGRLVGRISTKFRPNPRPHLPIRSKNITLLTGGVNNCTWGLDSVRQKCA